MRWLQFWSAGDKFLMGKTIDVPMSVVGVEDAALPVWLRFELVDRPSVRHEFVEKAPVLVGGRVPISIYSRRRLPAKSSKDIKRIMFCRLKGRWVFPLSVERRSLSVANFSLSFKARHGQAIPAELHEIVRFESMANEGVLSDQLGDVALITEALTPDRPIQMGIENMLVFTCVNQPRHVDYYCFPKAGEVSDKPMPVILVADQTIVQTWPNFRAFLDWVSGA